MTLDFTVRRNYIIYNVVIYLVITKQDTNTTKKLAQNATWNFLYGLPEFIVFTDTESGAAEQGGG